MVTGGGLITLLGLVVLYLLNSNRQDRQQHREVIKDLEAKIERVETKHALQIDRLDTKIDNLEREVDTERVARQAAEFEAQRARHQLSLLQGGKGSGA